MKVYCDNCKEEIADMNLLQFRKNKKILCTHCNTQNSLTTNSEKSAQIVIAITIVMMLLNSTGVITKDLYGIFLVVMVVIGLFAISNTKIITTSNKE